MIVVRNLIHEQCARELECTTRVGEESDGEALQVAHVPWPIVALEVRLELDGRPRERIDVPHPRSMLGYEVPQEGGDLVGSIAKPREEYTQEAEAGEEVVEQSSRLDEFQERLIRREDQAHIHRDVTPRTQRTNGPAVEDVEELALDGVGGLRELVAEERPAVRRLEGTRVTLFRVGEGAGFMSEQCGAGEGVIQSGETDLFELMFRSSGVRVHESSERGLARARGTEQYYGLLLRGVALELAQRIGERPSGRRPNKTRVLGAETHMNRGVPVRVDAGYLKTGNTLLQPDQGIARRDLRTALRRKQAVDNFRSPTACDASVRWRDEPSGPSVARGFTLIEILVVVVIIAILATLVAPNVFQHVGSARETTARSQIEMLGAALDAYRLHVGRYPSSQEGLAVLWERPAGAPSTWRGPYVRRPVPMDPWGHAYDYEASGAQGETTYRLVSFGADGKRGGEGEARDIDSQ